MPLGGSLATLISYDMKINCAAGKKIRKQSMVVTTAGGFAGFGSMNMRKTVINRRERSTLKNR